MKAKLVSINKDGEPYQFNDGSHLHEISEMDTKQQDTSCVGHYDCNPDARKVVDQLWTIGKHMVKSYGGFETQKIGETLP